MSTTGNCFGAWREPRSKSWAAEVWWQRRGLVRCQQVTRLNGRTARSTEQDRRGCPTLGVPPANAPPVHPTLFPRAHANRQHCSVLKPLINQPQGPLRPPTLPRASRPTPLTLPACRPVSALSVAGVPGSAARHMHGQREARRRHRRRRRRRQHCSFRHGRAAANCVISGVFGLPMHPQDSNPASIYSHVQARRPRSPLTPPLPSRAKCCMLCPSPASTSFTHPQDKLAAIARHA